MQHLFLTGPTRVGKSALIDRLLARHPDWRIGGFRTVTRPDGPPGALGGVYMLPGNAPDAPCGPGNRVGIRWENGLPQGFPEVFDHLGPAFLSPVDRDLLLMDELGFMERDAKAFSRAVLRALNGRLPVIGVVKPRSLPLLDAVRAHPSVRVIEVTQANRDGLLEAADGLLASMVKWGGETGGTGGTAGVSPPRP